MYIYIVLQLQNPAKHLSLSDLNLAAITLNNIKGLDNYKSISVRICMFLGYFFFLLLVEKPQYHRTNKAK